MKKRVIIVNMGFVDVVFEYVSALKGKLYNPGKGKGCVNISYDNVFDNDILITAIEEIIERQNSRLNI